MNVLEFNEKFLLGRKFKNMQGWGYLNPSVILSIFCKDGFHVSLQASKSHYCSPRDDHGPWFEVELGFPSQGDDRLLPYMEQISPDPTENVYGYVPLDIVLEVFESHGGIDEDKTVHWSKGKTMDTGEND